MPIDGLGTSQFDAYLEASREWRDPDDNPKAQKIVGRAQIKRLPAKGGPFDGEELQVPPGGSQVILPSAFGKGANLHGVSIYERQGQFMVYVGQGDHTVQVEEDDDKPKLILP